MTVRGRRSQRDARIKQRLVDNYTTSMIARLENISETRVRQIRNLFISSGELVEIPRTNPRILVDPHAHVLGSEFSNNGGGAEKNGLTRDNSPIRDSLPPNGRLPMGMVGAHIDGKIRMTVRAKGNFEDIEGSNGLSIGYWDDEGSGGRGKRHRKGHIHLFRQDLTCNYYISTKGTTEFYINPGRVYYYPSKVTVQQVMDYIIERCLYVASTLRANGWQVTDPQFTKNFQLHYQKENDSLARLIPTKYHREGQLITTDTSPDYLETEIEFADDERLVEIYANMPRAIDACNDEIDRMKADIPKAIGSCNGEIERMKAEILGLKEVIHLQGESITSLTGNISMLVKAMTEMTTLQTSFASRRYAEFTGEGYQ